MDRRVSATESIADKVEVNISAILFVIEEINIDIFSYKSK